jgi:four helix bundle protein
MEYNLEERTARFAERVIEFVRNLPINEVTRRLIPQLIDSSTSVAANYCEANEASSPKDFRNKICIAKKEVHESRLWLRLIGKAVPDKALQAKPLKQEAFELTLIFSKIVQTLSLKQKD